MSTIRNLFILPAGGEPCPDAVARQTGEGPGKRAMGGARGALRASLALLLLAALGARAFGQSATLRGFVSDAATGQPLAGVHVVLRDGDTVRGTTTSRDGLYLLADLRPGRYVLQASFIGFAPETDTLMLAEGQALGLDIELAPSELVLDEVVVQSDLAEGAARVDAGHVAVRSTDLLLVPAPGGGGDLLAYLTTLPGVVTTGDRGGQIFIRGGEPSQNLYLVDGMSVYQPAHMVGFYSLLSADMVSQADIYAGGYPSRFGERVSSVVDVSTRNGNLRRAAASTAASPFSVGAVLEGPLLRNRVSALLSGRRSMLRQWGESLVGQDLPFDFADVFGKVYGELSPLSRLTASVIYASDRGRLDAGTTESTVNEVHWVNRGVSLRYLLLPGSFPASARLRVSLSDYRSELGPEDAPLRSTAVRDGELAIEATVYSERVVTEIGLSARNQSVRNRLGGLYQNVRLSDASYSPAAFYLEPEFVLGHWRLLAGVRIQNFDVRTAPFVEPRLRFAWQRGRHQVSAAAGLYAQELVGITDRRDAANVFTIWSAAPRATGGIHLYDTAVDIREGRALQARHLILGWRADLPASLNASLEGYYKSLSNLLIAQWEAFPRLTTELRNATGWSAGLDARIELRLPALYLRLGYGLSRTRYRSEQTTLLIWYGVETMSFRPPHDRRHQLLGLARVSIDGFDVDVRWDYGSGLPFSQAIGFDGFVLIDGIRPYDEAPASRRVIYDRPFNAQLPAYHRLDVGISRRFTGSPIEWTLSASLLNVYNRSNLFFLDVYTLERVDQLPRFASLGITATL